MDTLNHNQSVSSTGNLPPVEGAMGVFNSAEIDDIVESPWVIDLRESQPLEKMLQRHQVDNTPDAGSSHTQSSSVAEDPSSIVPIADGKQEPLHFDPLHPPQNFSSGRQTRALHEHQFADPGENVSSATSNKQNHRSTISSNLIANASAPNKATQTASSSPNKVIPPAYNARVANITPELHDAVVDLAAAKAKLHRTHLQELPVDGKNLLSLLNRIRHQLPVVHEGRIKRFVTAVGDEHDLYDKALENFIHESNIFIDDALAVGPTTINRTTEGRGVTSSRRLAMKLDLMDDVDDLIVAFQEQHIQASTRRERFGNWLAQMSHDYGSLSRLFKIVAPAAPSLVLGVVVGGSAAALSAPILVGAGLGAGAVFAGRKIGHGIANVVADRAYASRKRQDQAKADRNRLSGVLLENLRQDSNQVYENDPDKIDVNLMENFNDGVLWAIKDNIQRRKEMARAGQIGAGAGLFIGSIAVHAATAGHAVGHSAASNTHNTHSTGQTLHHHPKPTTSPTPKPTHPVTPHPKQPVSGGAGHGVHKAPVIDVKHPPTPWEASHGSWDTIRRAMKLSKNVPKGNPLYGLRLHEQFVGYLSNGNPNIQIWVNNSPMNSVQQAAFDMLVKAA